MISPLLKRINRHALKMTPDEAFDTAWYYRKTLKDYTEYSRFMAVYNLSLFYRENDVKDRLIHWVWTRRYMDLIIHNTAWKLDR